MNSTTRSLARSAIVAGLGVVILYLASILPGGRVFLLCAASFCVAFIRMSCSWKWALGCWIVITVLSLSLFPTKATAILFGTFFGYYPVIKLAAERLPHPVLRWGIKLAVFDLVMVLLWLTVRSVFQVEGGILSSYPVVMVIAANAAFVLYDLALGQGILFYIRKIARRIE